MSYDDELEWRVEFHKALSNPVRLQIIELLTDRELCQCDIFPKIGLSQSTISAYLTQLVKADILSFRKDGTRKMYSMKNPEIKVIIETIRTLAEEMA